MLALQGDNFLAWILGLTLAHAKNNSVDRVWPSAVEQQPDGLPVGGSYSRADVTGTCRPRRGPSFVFEDTYEIGSEI